MKVWLAIGVFCFVMSFVSVFALSFVNMLLAFIGFGVFAVAGVLILLITGSKVNTGNQHLLTMSGTRRGRATILSSEPTHLFLRTGEVEYPPQTYRLQLRVELDGEGTYEVRHHQGIQPWQSGRFAPGRVVDCIVHPRRRSVVHLLLDSSPSSADLSAFGPLGGLLAGRLGGTAEVQSPVTMPTMPAMPTASGSLRDATAIVNSARDLGPSPTGRQAVELDLLIAVVGEAPYRVVIAAERPPGAVPRQGETLRVLVDPTRPSTIHILD